MLHLPKINAIMVKLRLGRIIAQLKEDTMIKKLNTMAYRLGAIATVGYMMQASNAHAGSGFQDATGNINESVQDFPSLISTAAYIGGAGLAVAGVLKMKAHVDNPQTPLKDGLVRLGAGGGLLALPFVMDSMQSTIGQGTFDQAPSIPSVQVP